MKSISQTVCFGIAMVAMVIGLATRAVHADVVDFEGGLDPMFAYTAVSTLDGTGLPVGSGYYKMAAMTPGTMVSFNPFAGSPASFKWADPSTLFNLDSFLIAGAWGTQTLTFRGLRDGIVLHTDSLFVGPDPQAFSPEWQNLDEFQIAIGTDFTDTVDGGTGQHWSLDNLVVEACDIAPVPEPATMSLLFSGACALWWKRRQSQA